MKHAYLILAHNQFAILHKLIEALDDARNDIYIHIDKKVQQLPQLAAKHARLCILSKRIEVFWGDVSIVEAELLLFATAREHGNYAYYHLLSGVDMPLKSQDEIHQFFADHSGKQFIGFSPGNQNKKISRKVQRYHLFPKKFRSVGGIEAFFIRFIRFLALETQIVFGIKRSRDTLFKKGTQWVSVTQDFVDYIVHLQKLILKQYQNTFCADEIFIQTLCWNSAFRDAVFDYQSEGRSAQRIIRWIDNILVDWDNSDFDQLMSSDLLFARKFNEDNLIVVNRILKKITDTDNEGKADG